MDLPVIPMSVEEFEVMEQPFGWKVEYWDGKAHLTPRSIGVTTKLQLTDRSTQNSAPFPYQLLPVTAESRQAMLDGYFVAFADSVEFCGWPVESIKESAQKDITRYFDGVRGEPLSASVIAVNPDSGQLVGLALFIRKPPEMLAYMDLLYVLPEFQRQGIASAMLDWAGNRLRLAGFDSLSSAYHICNQVSQRWHQRQGFVEEYDWYYARLKVGWYNHEIWRRQSWA